MHFNMMIGRFRIWAHWVGVDLIRGVWHFGMYRCSYIYDLHVVKYPYLDLCLYGVQIWMEKSRLLHCTEARIGIVNSRFVQSKLETSEKGRRNEGNLWPWACQGSSETKAISWMSTSWFHILWKSSNFVNFVCPCFIGCDDVLELYVGTGFNKQKLRCVRDSGVTRAM